MRGALQALLEALDGVAYAVDGRGKVVAVGEAQWERAAVEGGAPELLSAEISICIKNGDRQTLRTARVLPHESRSTRIPIQLVNAEQKTPAKLIA